MPEIILKYYNSNLKIGVGKWNEVFYWPNNETAPVALKPEYYKGALVYRLPGSCKRISYKIIKAGLKHEKTIIFIDEFKMPF